MEDKKLDEKSLEELAKAADAFRDFTTNLADKLSKVLADIKAYKEEDTWEMKCPYEYGNKYYFLQSSGDSFLGRWDNIEADNSFFSQGNIFPTREAAELEAKRRNLLTRFRAFRDECNGDWKADFKKKTAKKMRQNGISLITTGNYKLHVLTHLTILLSLGISKKREGPYVLSNCLVTKSKNCLWIVRVGK